MAKEPDESPEEDRPARRRFPALAVAWLVVLLSFGGVVGWLWWEAHNEAQQQAEAAPEGGPPQDQPADAVSDESVLPATADSGKEADGPAESEPAVPPIEQAAEPAAPQEEPKDTAESAPQPAPPPATAPASEATAQADAVTARLSLPPIPAPDPGKPDPTVTLPPVPDPALVVETEKGPLPVIGPDGRRPWQAYARPFHAPTKAPRIALIIGDMGLSAPATNAAIQQLPGAVTLAFAPYANDLQDWIGKSRAAGHEVMLQLPMEPYDFPANDPGPHALLTTLSPGANLERLEWLLGRFTGYVGVTNYMGSKFTASAKDVRPVMEALRARGLMFVDARSSTRSVAGSIARDIGIPLAFNNHVIDREASRNAIDAQLAELERIALEGGTAVGIGYPYPVTLERVARWAATLPQKGIHLAPASATVDRQSP
ncbi:MAG: divergent polysaccharide deacetylase family protein [Minwuiales bacterium]|nr:divergent polysaccharide deacetylase family protein [Minwuiales bacterium]